MDPDRIDVVLFDLDDTLCEYRRTQEELLEIAFDRAGIDPFFDAETYRQRFGEFIAESDGVDDLRERSFVSIANERGRDPELAREVAAHYAAARDPTGVDPREGALEAVEALDERYTLGLVTNGGPDLQRGKLVEVGLEDAFETIVFAGHETPTKPDPEPFDRALSTLDASPDRAVHVGNSLRSDVAGAHAAGLYSVWTPNGDPREDPDEYPDPHVRVDDVATLPEPL